MSTSGSEPRDGVRRGRSWERQLKHQALRGSVIDARGLGPGALSSCCHGNALGVLSLRGSTGIFIPTGLGLVALAPGSWERMRTQTAGVFFLMYVVSGEPSWGQPLEIWSGGPSSFFLLALHICQPHEANEAARPGHCTNIPIFNPTAPTPNRHASVATT